MFKQFDEKYKDSSVWQFIKFNLVSATVTIVQLILANVLPFLFDSFQVPLPGILRGIFNPDVLFQGESIYVVNGVTTWGYVLPFFLSNLLANIYGYFVNMKATFRGKGTKGGFVFYIVVMIGLILFSTWLQGYLVSLMMGTSLEGMSRTIASMAAGMVQMLVMFPLEKFVLFKEKAE